MITAGIDCGAKNTKTIILKDGKIMGMGCVLTGVEQGKAVAACLARALESAGVVRSQINGICATGSGKKSINMADVAMDDIKAMAAGAHFLHPEVRTVIDVGAEEGRAAKIDEKGNVMDFAVNERCAAGVGAFIEVMARALDVPVEEMGLLSLKSDQEIPMNAQCVVFAESEAVGLIHAGTEKQDISKAIHDAMAERIVFLVRRVGVNEAVALMGGVGYNQGLVAVIKRELRVNILIPDAPEYGAAVGAAVTAGKTG
ncbi:MAG: acyl-CoA dehydratase activase [Thermodesulfobacteriota bacterium]